MNLQSLLAARVDANKPVRVGLIGAGKFGSMFLAQVPSIRGLDVAVIADLDPERAKAACRAVGWDAARVARTRFVSDGREACTDERVDVVIEATGGIVPIALLAVHVKTQPWEPSDGQRPSPTVFPSPQVVPVFRSERAEDRL